MPAGAKIYIPKEIDYEEIGTDYKMICRPLAGVQQYLSNEGYYVYHLSKEHFSPELISNRNSKIILENHFDLFPEGTTISFEEVERLNKKEI